MASRSNEFFRTIVSSQPAQADLIETLRFVRIGIGAVLNLIGIKLYATIRIFHISDYKIRVKSRLDPIT